MNDKEKTKIGIIVIGLIILIGGIIIFFSGYYTMKDIEKLNTNDIPKNQFIKSLSEDLQTQYNDAEIIFYVGIIVSVIAIIILVIGVIEFYSLKYRYCDDCGKLTSKLVEFENDDTILCQDCYNSIQNEGVIDNTQSQNQALDILKVRLAKGEISIEEYKQKKDDILN